VANNFPCLLKSMHTFMSAYQCIFHIKTSQGLCGILGYLLYGQSHFYVLISILLCTYSFSD
jgi:hypothetical protein